MGAVGGRGSAGPSPWGSDYSGTAASAFAGTSRSAAYSGAGAAADVVRKAQPEHGLRVQQKVFHAKFGEGTVLTLEGSGNDARAQINFPRHGTKWLALSVAKLTPVP